MKAFFLACIAGAVIAIIGVVVLNRIQEPADRAFSTSRRAALMSNCSLVVDYLKTTSA